MQSNCRRSLSFGAKVSSVAAVLCSVGLHTAGLITVALLFLLIVNNHDEAHTINGEQNMSLD